TAGSYESLREQLVSVLKRGWPNKLVLHSSVTTHCFRRLRPPSMSPIMLWKDPATSLTCKALCRSYHPGSDRQSRKPSKHSNHFPAQLSRRTTIEWPTLHNSTS